MVRSKDAKATSVLKYFFVETVVSAASFVNFDLAGDQTNTHISTALDPALQIRAETPPVTYRAVAVLPDRELLI